MKHQRDKMRNLFVRNPFTWIPLPEIMKIAAQYNARVYDLRREGMNIINKKKRVDGIDHSWFKYLPTEENGQMRCL